MRSVTVKWMMLIASLLVAVIIVVQLYWLNKVYSYEQKQFNSNVVRSIRGLLEDIDLADYPATDLHRIIQHPDPNSFLVVIDSIPPKDTLVFYMTNELEDFEVSADCKIGVYSDSTDKYLYETYLPTAASREPMKANVVLPTIKKNYSYLYLFFPNRKQYILDQLGLWILGSILLILALLGLVASLFYLYKQKTLNEVQKDFVNNFTHEFKTPLAVMKLASDVLTSPTITQQPDRLKKYGSIIQEQTAHLQGQVEKLLKTVTTDAHELKLEISNFSPNDVVKNVIQLLDPLIKERHARIEFQLEENNLHINADESHMSMVLVNLIENSIKYSKDPLVILTTVQENGSFIISVKDNGIGIDKKYIPLLFKKFFRVPTGDVHNVKGFGLGLNFVKKVIDAHNGKIVVSSLPGIGTEFKILLPNLLNTNL